MIIASPTAINCIAQIPQTIAFEFGSNKPPWKQRSRNDYPIFINISLAYVENMATIFKIIGKVLYIQFEPVVSARGVDS